MTATAPASITVQAEPATGRRHRRRPDIQGLRAVAVLLVIANHAHVPGFGGGYAGVDVFFVISGFVITRQLLDDRPAGIVRRLGGFYARRVRRIVPAATATLISTLLAARIFLGSQLDPALFGDVRWSALFGANARLISTGSDYFVPGVAPSLITQFWSLAVEEQFYLVLPILFLTCARLRPRALAPTLFCTLLPLVALSAWWSAHSSPNAPTVAYYSPFTRFWELGVGCLLAAAMTRHPAGKLRRIATPLGVLGLLLTLLVLPGAADYPGTLAWLPVTSTALLLWAGADLFAARPLTWIGDRSYSLYLWHWVWLQLPGQLADPHLGLGWRLLELAGTTVTATLSYRYLENPLRRSRRLAADQIAVWLLLAVCMIGVVTVTLVVSRFTV